VLLSKTLHSNSSPCSNSPHFKYRPLWPGHWRRTTVDGLLKRIPNYSIQGIRTQLIDEEYSLEEDSSLDAYLPELNTEAGDGPEISVYLLCIIRSAYTEDEAQSSFHEGTGSPSYSYRLILGRKPNAVAHTRTGRYRYHMPNRGGGLGLLRWQKSFERKTITTVYHGNPNMIVAFPFHLKFAATACLLS
jgi:hypothetical protein